MLFYHAYYFYDNVRRYVRRGYFSTPNEGDYISEKLRARFPCDTTPTKAEIQMLKTIEEERHGGRS